MMTRRVATVEARMTSSRLPGKVLMEVSGQPILFFLIERLKMVEEIDEIVLATTTNSEDDCLEDFALENKVKCFRGSEDDVMERVLNAGISFEADEIVEITGDCPLIDPEIVTQVINVFKANNAVYVNNNHFRSYPDGMDVQIFKLDALKQSFSMTQDKLDREHVTLHMRNNPDLFRPIHLVAPKTLYWPELGLTLDEQGDFFVLEQIIQFFNPKIDFSLLDVLNYLRDNPKILEMNSYVIRKGDT